MFKEIWMHSDRFMNDLAEVQRPETPSAGFLKAPKLRRLTIERQPNLIFELQLVEKKLFLRLQSIELHLLNLFHSFRTRFIQLEEWQRRQINSHFTQTFELFELSLLSSDEVLVPNDKGMFEECNSVKKSGLDVTGSKVTWVCEFVGQSSWAQWVTQSRPHLSAQ